MDHWYCFAMAMLIAFIVGMIVGFKGGQDDD